MTVSHVIELDYSELKFLREGLLELMSECDVAGCEECKDISKLIKKLRGAE